MRIPSNIAAASVTAATTPKAGPLTDERPVWTNPAASAALRSTADLLTSIEAGIVRNMGDVGLVRAYAIDLRSTLEIYDAATNALSTDASKENDSFLPLISTAGGGVTHAESRLSSKELTSTWPIERGDILAAIRRAKSISLNVADQLDPRSNRDPR